MTDKEIIIDGYKLEDIKNLLFTGQRMSISTKTFEAIIDELQHKEQECERYKKVLKELDEMAKYDCVHECSNNYKICTIGSCLEKRIQRKVNEVLKDD